MGQYHEQIERLLKQKELVEAIELNVQADHVHMVVEIPPKYWVSAIMGFLKGETGNRSIRTIPTTGA